MVKKDVEPRKGLATNLKLSYKQCIQKKVFSDIKTDEIITVLWYVKLN